MSNKRASQTDETARPRRKGNLRAAVRRAQQGSGISWPRILAAALAAVTMTLLSTRLTSVFGSLMLTAVISIGAALATEFYRVLINITAEGTKKVVAPIIYDLEGEHPTGETDNGGAAKTSEPERESATAADTAALATAETEEDAQETAADVGNRKLSQFTVLALIFGLVSLITIGVSYAVARAQGGDIYHNTTIEQPIQNLTDEQRAALVELAAQAARDGLPDVTDLQNQLAELQSQNNRLQQTVDELTAQQQSDAQQITDLQTQLDQLRQDLESVEPETEGIDPGGG